MLRDRVPLCWLEFESVTIRSHHGQSQVTYLAVSLPSLGAITCPLSVEECMSTWDAGIAPNFAAFGCLTP